MRPSALAASALLLATCALAACGGADKDAYLQAVTNSQQQALADATTRLNAFEKATTVPKQASELKAFGESFRTSARRLDSVEAPGDVAELHRDYVEAMNTLGTQLESLSEELRRADAEPAPTTEAQARTRERELTAILRRTTPLVSAFASTEAKVTQDINDELR